MLTLKDFEPLTLEHKPLFEKIYSSYPPRHSESMFTTLVSWLHYVDVRLLEMEETILLITEFDGHRQFRPPLGKPNAELLKAMVGLAKQEEGVRAIVGIEESKKEWMVRHCPDLEFVPNPDYFDYVYLTSDLAELRGKNYLKIRNKLNRFNKRYEHTVEPITRENFDEVVMFLRRWCLWRDCESNAMLENERIAVMYSIGNFFDLGLSGIAIRMGPSIEAISVFERMNEETAVIHFEKAMPDYDGIYQAINNAAAKILAKDYKFINRESDLGIEGLKEAKKRYHPHHMEKVYYIEREGLGV